MKMTAPDALEMSTPSKAAEAAQTIPATPESKTLPSTPPNSPNTESVPEKSFENKEADGNLQSDFDLHPTNPAHVQPETKAANKDEALYDPLFGIGFSGGGVRSASFCSGVLWELMKHPRAPVGPHDESYIELPKGVLPKYISCVSGGGYIGSSFLYWVRLKNGVDPRIWAQEYFTHMRNSVGYYIDFSHPLAAIRDLVFTLIMIATLIFFNLLSILPTVFILSTVMFVSFVAYEKDFLGGTSEHADVHMPSTWFNSRIGWFITFFCLASLLPGLLSLWANASANYSFVGLFHGEPHDFTRREMILKWKKAAAVAIGQFHWTLTSAVMLIMFYQIFVSGSQESSLSGSGVFTALIFRLLLVVALIFHFPGLFGLAFLAQFITWILSHDHSFFVFWNDSDSNTDTTSFDTHYYYFVLASKFLLPFIGLLSLTRERMLFEFSRWRLQRTFYGPTATLFSSKEKTPKEMLIYKPPAHSKGQYPTYIAQCTVNNWRLAPTNQMALLKNLERTREADFYFQNLPKGGPLRQEIYRYLTKAEAVLSTPGPHDLNYLQCAVDKAKAVINADPELRKLAETFERNKEIEVKEVFFQLQRVALADKQAANANYDALALPSDGPWERYESGLIESLRFEPETSIDIAIGTAMAMSAAAGSFVNGDFGTVGKFNEDTQVLLGGHMGRWIATRHTKYWYCILPLCLILPALLIFLPAILHGSFEDPCWYYWEQASSDFRREDLITGCHWWLHDNVWAPGRQPPNSETRHWDVMLWCFGGELLSALFLLIWTLVTPFLAKLIPAQFPFLPFARLLTMLAGHSWWGQDIPPMLYISDGGHTENLGLLPLLARRLTTIVLVNGGQDPDCLDLRSALKQAHNKLGIMFRPLPADRVRRKQEHITSDANLDLEADITYFCKDKFQRVLVFEAVYTNPSESLLIPRPARYAYDGSPQYATIFYLQPTRLHPDGLIGRSRGEDLDGASVIQSVPETHKSLAGCCCTCCHRVERLLPVSGAFPFHSTAFQFFTPMMYDAYHAQGARAMRDALGVKLRLHTRLKRQSRLEMLWQRNQDYANDPIRIPKELTPMHHASRTELEGKLEAALPPTNLAAALEDVK